MLRIVKVTTKIPSSIKWRVAIYVAVILFCSWLIGERYGDRGLVVGVAVGTTIILIMFALAAHVIRHRMNWIKSHLGLLVGIFIALQLLLILLTFIQKH